MTTNTTELGGLIPVVPTPFLDGAVDAQSVETIMAWLAPHVDGVLALGSSGEAGYLSLSQRLRALNLFLEAGHRYDLPVVAGITDPAIENVHAFLRGPDASAVSAWLVLPPTYYPATLGAAERHLATIADAVDQPIVLYDIPGLSGLSLSTEDIVRLAERIPTLRYVKVCHPSLTQLADLAQHDRLRLFAGYDEVLHEQVVEGCSGAMVPVIAMCPEPARRWYDTLLGGDQPEAFAIFTERLAPLIRAMVGTDVDFIAVVKQVLHERGILASADTAPGLPTLLPPRARQVDEVLGYLAKRA
jgi:4-hydroxy-tetrahydrodipicolinate synthase